MASSRPFSALRAQFGRFQLDLGSRELSCSGVRIPIQEQPLQILRLLLEADGQVVSREQIRTALWPEDTFVDFEHDVNTAVKKLRQALEDSAENPEYVETLPRVGYRFLVPVEWGSGTQESKPAAVVVMPSHEPSRGPHLAVEPELDRRRWKLVVAVALAAVSVAAVALIVLMPDGFLSKIRKKILSPPELANRVPQQPAMGRRRLTASPEDAPVTSAAISPDGKYLAYTDSTGFYLRLVETGETHPVSLPREFAPSVESWFPDSVHLVISWIEDSGRPPSLWVISVLGGTPRKLTDVGSFARVSPDGAQVVFMRGSWDDNEIWLSDPNGNGARKIVDGGLDYFGPAAWSPDGKEFAFVRASVERPEGRIQTYDVGKGRVETVLSLAGLGSDICWVRSGELVYSLVEAPPNQDNSNLWSVQLDTRTGRPAGAAVRISDDHDRVGSITATSDGKRLAVLRFTYQQDVYLASIEDKGKRISSPRRFTLDQRQDFPSSWTPDSKAVLIVSNRDGVSHIFRQKIDETQPELFVGGKQDVWLPHMTPDGLDMLYLASPEQVGPTDKVRMMSISLAGGPSRVILEEPGIVSYQCARLPSKTCVYGQVEAELLKFFLFDSSRGNRSELPIKMKKGSAMNNWNLSPDGRYLAISETRNPYEGPRLRLISLIDQTERQLSTSQPRLIIGVDWAADAKSLWLGGFMSRGSWGARSGLVNVDLGGHVTAAIEGRAPVIMGATPSPDGHTLALGANTFSSNVWLLDKP